MAFLWVHRNTTDTCSKASYGALGNIPPPSRLKVSDDFRHTLVKTVVLVVTFALCQAVTDHCAMCTKSQLRNTSEQEAAERKNWPRQHCRSPRLSATVDDDAPPLRNTNVPRRIVALDRTDGELITANWKQMATQRGASKAAGGHAGAIRRGSDQSRSVSFSFSPVHKRQPRPSDSSPTGPPELRSRAMCKNKFIHRAL